MQDNHSKIGNAEKTLARYILVVFVIFALSFYTLATVKIAYSQKIPPKTSVAGINIGGMNIEQARKLITLETTNFSKIKIHLRFAQKTFAPSLANLGIAVDVDKTINKAYAANQNTHFTGRLKNSFNFLVSPNEIMYELKIDESKYNGYFRQLAKNIKQAPKNASLQITGGKINYLSGRDGQSLNADQAKKEIIASLTAGKYSAFTLKTIITPPYIQEEQTIAAREEAKTWMKAKIVLSVHYDPKASQTKKDQQFTASAAEIGQWINFREGATELEANLSLTAISDWVTDVNSQATIPAINNKINIRNGKQELLAKGEAGQELDLSKSSCHSGSAPNALAGGIAAAVKAGGKTIKLNTKILKPLNEIIGGVIPGRFPGKYIEVVLSQQKMYVFDGKKLVNTYLISSGKMGMNTPAGQYKILRKTTWATCKPSTEYKTCYMPYSMFFTNQGHAIHELPIIDGWREGSWHLGIPVSHGCIRLGIGPAAYMYNWTPVGTPLIIHS